MSKINNPVEYSIQDFVNNIYTPDNRNLIFWDTCALLEIFRFPYRDGDLNTYKILNRINGLIQNNIIYSVASSLTITEWNDNEDEVKNDTQISLEKTGNYHNICLEVTNEIFTTTYLSEPIHNKNLIQSFEALVDNIISKTIFIQTDEIANNALERVRDKKPPASKKQEFKDCTVWETALKLSRDIYAIETDNLQVFYTVNTDDFLDKSREPKVFHATLLTEASLSNLNCCSNTSEVNTRL